MSVVGNYSIHSIVTPHRSAFVKSSGKDERSVNAIMGGSGINFKLVHTYVLTQYYIAMSKVNRTRGRTTDVHYYTHKSLIQKKSYFHLWTGQVYSIIFRAQSFTSLIGDLRQDINRVSSFSTQVP